MSREKRFAVYMPIERRNVIRDLLANVRHRPGARLDIWRLFIMLWRCSIVFSTVWVVARSKAFKPLLIGSALACVSVFVVPSMATAEQGKCYTGLDCPGDFTGNPRPGTPPSKVLLPTTLGANRQLTCVTDCDSDDPSNSMAVKITVVSFAFDKDHAKTTMRIRLDSEHNESDCHFGAGDGFQFENEAGKTYVPGGPLKNGGSFSLVGGQSLTLNGIYSFLPSRNSLYTLRPLYLVCAQRDGNIGYTPTYGDMQFTFDW